MGGLTPPLPKFGPMACAFCGLSMRPYFSLAMDLPLGYAPPRSNLPSCPAISGGNPKGFMLCGLVICHGGFIHESFIAAVLSALEIGSPRAFVVVRDSVVRDSVSASVKMESFIDCTRYMVSYVTQQIPRQSGIPTIIIIQLQTIERVIGEIEV